MNFPTENYTSMIFKENYTYHTIISLLPTHIHIEEQVAPQGWTAYKILNQDLPLYVIRAVNSGHAIGRRTGSPFPVWQSFDPRIDFGNIFNNKQPRPSAIWLLSEDGRLCDPNNTNICWTDINGQLLFTDSNRDKALNYFINLFKTDNN